MIELCWGIIFFLTAAAIDWLLGVYDKIGVQKIAWSWETFFRKTAKVILLVGCAIGLGVIWEFSGLDLSGAGLTPLTVTTTGTIYYAFKAIKHFAYIIKGYKKDDEVTKE